MVDKIKNTDEIDDDIYKFEELIDTRHYLHFKLSRPDITSEKYNIECSILYMPEHTTPLEECSINCQYIVDLIIKKKWDSFIKFIKKNSDNKKFYYGFLQPDETEIFLTYPYETSIGARLTLTHIIAEFIRQEDLLSITCKNNNY